MGKVKTVQGPGQLPSRLKKSKGQVTNGNLLRNGQKGRKSSRRCGVTEPVTEPGKRFRKGAG